MSSGTQPEVVVARLHPHARALFWPSALLVAVAGATAFLAEALPERWHATLLLAVAGLVVLLGVIAPLLSWLSRSTTITTRRVVVRRGVLVRTRQELLHARSYDVTLRRSGLQLLFGSGDVIVNAGLESPVVLRDVPRAALVQAALQDLIGQDGRL